MNEMTVTRRRALALLTAVPAALVSLPLALEAAAPDPIDAAAAHLWAGFEAAVRDPDVGASDVALARRAVDLLDRLQAEHGDEAGGAIWREAMARHTRRVRAWGREHA